MVRMERAEQVSESEQSKQVEQVQRKGGLSGAAGVLGVLPAGRADDTVHSGTALRCDDRILPVAGERLPSSVGERTSGV